MSNWYSEVLGIPYKRNGRDLNGFDCFGLVQYTYKKDGIIIPDYITPDEDNMVYQMVIEGRKLWQKLDKPVSGCVVLFRVRSNFFHMGRVTEDCKHFIHIMQKRNVCKERLDHPIWRNRIEGFYRWIIEN